MKLKSDNSKFLSLGLHFMIGEQGTDLPSSKKKKRVIPGLVKSCLCFSRTRAVFRIYLSYAIKYNKTSHSP